MSRFEKTLVEETSRNSTRCATTSAKISMRRPCGAPATSCTIGSKLQARFPFRTVTSRFISVGSYHMLANEVRVGWHRDYLRLLKPAGDGDGE